MEFINNLSTNLLPLKCGANLQYKSSSRFWVYINFLLSSIVLFAVLTIE